jgi:hypothetical protein
MAQIVINACFGGFSLSPEAIRLYASLKGITLIEKESPCGFHEPDFYDADDQFFSAYDIPRDDPDLISAIKMLGADANGRYAQLKIVTIPDGIEWEIEEYDGNEHIAEQHRTWS